MARKSLTDLSKNSQRDYLNRLLKCENNPDPPNQLENGHIVNRNLICKYIFSDYI